MSSMSLSVIRRDETADALREAILDGRLGPGDRLVEDRVMEWLGATRSGARKAFRQLEHEGLLISYPYRGVEVLGVSPEEVHGVLIPIRLMLERFAFSKALEVMASRDLEAIAGQLDVMAAAAAAGDVDAVVDADLAFHEAVLQVVPQFHTVQIWHSIAPRIRAYFRRESLARDLDSVVDEHRALLAALRSGDRKTVLEMLEQHIKRVRTEGEPRA
jgi:DNA-binding GntR family transcriptional regulator